MREKRNTCCFTGHRDISAVTYDQLVRNVEPLVRVLMENGYQYFVCGGALGFDTFAATYICSLKQRGYNIKLVLMLPCRDQAAKWSDYSRRVYNSILSRADEIVYISDVYSPGCMQKRNRALVDASSACICYLTSEIGGTKHTVDYAFAQGVPVVNVALDARK